MNIHKISSNFKEHQNLLAQNRKDPITGDSILEGDEVVFCASCKSVFLKDTWEYLGNRHCEQTRTLINFPLSSLKLDLTAKEDILFYTFLRSNQIAYISLNLNIWQQKEGKIAQQNYILYRKPLFYILVVLILISSFSFYIFMQTLLPFICGCVFSLLLFFIGEIEQHIQGINLKTIHSEFVEDVFYISKQGIGLSKKFGVKEFILSSTHIDSLTFNFYSFYQEDPYENNYCIIKEKNGETIQFQIMNLLIESTKDIFLKVLHTLSDKCSISINVKNSGSDSNIYHNLEYVIKEKKYNINICKS